MRPPRFFGPSTPQSIGNIGIIDTGATFAGRSAVKTTGAALCGARRRGKIDHVLDAPPFNSTDYLRCARRLRCLHQRDPLRLARSLRELSHAYDAMRQAREARRPRRTPAGVSPALSAFAQRVADALEGTTLRYSNRIRLLRYARQQGIRRFDANLIIAAVQERVQGSGFRVLEQQEPRRTWKSTVLMFALFEGVVLAGAGYLFVL